MADETQPLLAWDENEFNHHKQYCMLVGIPPSDIPKSAKNHKANPNTLYERAKRKRTSTNLTYGFTAALSNTLLLSQVVLGAALTALGASESSHILITVFGALNTVIAGTVAYLKSRGQPMRARMFRDDLERVVDEIENSEIMWLGISKRVHGYDEIDIDDHVSVRSEVARLTKLYDRAVKNNTMNNPDMYMAGGGGDAFQQLRARPLPGQPALPAVLPAPAAGAAVPGAPAAVAAPEVEESPATAKPAPHADAAKDESGDDPKDTAKDASSDKKDDQAASGAAPATGSKTEDPASTSGAGETKPEPPAGTPLAADTDEGPVTAIPETKTKDNDKS